jgi:hypothetical protein
MKPWRGATLVGFNDRMEAAVMRVTRWLAVATVIAAMAGCAALESPVTKGQRLVGSDASAVQAQFGPPRET